MSEVAKRVAAALAGQTNLYGALERGAAGLTESEVADVLPQVMRLLGDTPEAKRLRMVDQGLLQAVVRHAAGLHPTVNGRSVEEWFATCDPAPMFLPEIATAARMALLDRAAGMPAYSDRAFDDWFAAKGVTYGLGPYGEDRAVYQTPQFADAASAERRTVHLGIDVFAKAGTAVNAPLDGRVAFVTYNADPLDYGHTLILEHKAEGVPFWTLYGHLGGSLPSLCRVGEPVVAGQVVAHLGDWHENGGWSAHLHFQVMTDLLEQRAGNFFGVGHRSLWPVWRAICPDPNLILRLPDGAFGEATVAPLGQV
jgi:hypothetical protein